MKVFILSMFALMCCTACHVTNTTNDEPVATDSIVVVSDTTVVNDSI